MAVVLLRVRRIIFLILGIVSCCGGTIMDVTPRATNVPVARSLVLYMWYG
jgi:hypothetical protein